MTAGSSPFMNRLHCLEGRREKVWLFHRNLEHGISCNFKSDGQKQMNTHVKTGNSTKTACLMKSRNSSKLLEYRVICEPNGSNGKNAPHSSTEQVTNSLQ